MIHQTNPQRINQMARMRNRVARARRAELRAKERYERAFKLACEYDAMARTLLREFARRQANAARERDALYQLQLELQETA